MGSEPKVLPNASNIANRIAARQHAQEVLKVVTRRSPRKHPQGYWEAIRRKAQENLPDSPAYWPGIEPMTDEEAEAFLKEAIPFDGISANTVGELMATAKGRVILEDLSGNRFVDRLRRFLRNKTISAQFGD